ncbi:hypothetical protein ACFV5G_05805 [Streptomyces sp. NPDC059766]
MATGKPVDHGDLSLARGSRAVATRYGKRTYVFHRTVIVAAIGLWLRD